MTLMWRVRYIVAKKPRTRLLSRRCQEIAHVFAYMMCTIVFNMAQFIDLLCRPRMLLRQFRN